MEYQPYLAWFIRMIYPMVWKILCLPLCCCFGWLPCITFCKDLFHKSDRISFGLLILAKLHFQVEHLLRGSLTSWMAMESNNVRLLVLFPHPRFPQTSHPVAIFLFFSCFSLSNISLMPVSLTSVFTWKWSLPIPFVSTIFTDIQLHVIPFRLSLLTGPTVHQPSLVWNAYGPLSLLGIILSGSKVFYNWHQSVYPQKYHLFYWSYPWCLPSTSIASALMVLLCHLGLLEGTSL